MDPAHFEERDRTLQSGGAAQVELIQPVLKGFRV
jgi:hypothetical protein